MRQPERKMDAHKQQRRNHTVQRRRQEGEKFRHHQTAKEDFLQQRGKEKLKQLLQDLTMQLASILLLLMRICQYRKKI